MASSSEARNLKRRRSPSPPVVRKKGGNEPGVASRILDAELKMSTELDLMRFSSPVTHVYNPLEYAWKAHEWFVNSFGDSQRKVLLVGMNPGPWGMAQTGVPFGQVETVKNWLKMPADMEIRKPAKENPKRPVLGLATTRSEVSGTRLWQEWAEATYGTPEKFFETFFVHNYCPLMMMEKSGRNKTPDKLPIEKRKIILQICDAALLEVIEAMQPSYCLGIGGFAAKRCKSVLEQAGKEDQVQSGQLLHPSPASPAANGGKWIGTFTGQLDALLQ